MSNLEFFENEDEVKVYVKRFEDMIERATVYYFDVHEFEDIIDYYIHLREIEEAYRAVEYGLKQHPNASSIKMKQAQLLIEKGRHIKALRLLEDLEKLDQLNYNIFLMQGSVYSTIGDIRKAEEVFEKAIQNAFDIEFDVYFAIAKIYEHVTEYDLAIKHYKRAFKLNPDDTEILNSLGYCYEKVKNYEKSIRAYSKFLDEEPFSAEGWYNLGVVYNKHSEHEKALDAYEFALAIDDRFQSAL